MTEKPTAPSCLIVHEPSEALPVEPVLVGDLGVRIEQLLRELDAVDRWLRDGIDPPSRVLFFGPTGTGKTLITRWLARRLRLPCAVVDLSSVMGKYLGDSPGNIGAAFNYAAERPCVLFLDEVETILARRDKLSGGGGDQERALTVTTFFQRLDALAMDRIVIAATNYVDSLDPATLRRFSERIEFVRPKLEERRRLLEGVIAGVKIPGEMKTAIVDRMLADESIEDLGGADLRAHAMRLVRRMVGTPPASPGPRPRGRRDDDCAPDGPARLQGILSLLGATAP